MTVTTKKASKSTGKKAAGSKKSAPKGSGKKKAAEDDQEPLENFRRIDAGEVDEFDLSEDILPGEQPELPTMETEAIPAIERKAKEFAGHEDKKKEFSAKSKVSGAELIHLMLEHDIVVYNTHGVHVDLSKELKVKVELDGGK